MVAGRPYRISATFGIRDLLLVGLIAALLISIQFAVAGNRQRSSTLRRLSSVQNRPLNTDLAPLQLFLLPVHGDGQVLFRIKCNSELELVAEERYDGEMVQAIATSVPEGPARIGIRLVSKKDGKEATIAIREGPVKQMTTRSLPGHLVLPIATWRGETERLTLATSGGSTGRSVRFYLAPK